MCERQNTLVCAFEDKSPRTISAFGVHEWIYAQMSVIDQEITKAHIDWPQRNVCIKFRDNERIQDVVHSTGVRVEYRHTSGVVSIVRMGEAGMGRRKLQIVNLLPEVRDGVLRKVLTRYGEVIHFQAKIYSHWYLYPLANGICPAMITLSKLVPFHMTGAGHRAQVLCDGQSM
jgi:hypothetical protein